eukprot:CAMPEP_0114556962 /NCGR_PEP_ID=MMETSP0114-20121206/9567_1 /TAXON_ID=31324 /ORGANISM="Goniomonas sp, Strain m" /LENGTH=55 /DNA_ID=CAMNT_0001742199 /DNA_START=59 /DNA_END=226 /DNA_ORIENTATION=-
MFFMLFQKLFNLNAFNRDAFMKSANEVKLSTGTYKTAVNGYLLPGSKPLPAWSQY